MLILTLNKTSNQGGIPNGKGSPYRAAFIYTREKAIASGRSLFVRQQAFSPRPNKQTSTSYKISN